MVRDASVNAVSEGRNELDGFCSSEGKTTNCDILGLDGAVRDARFFHGEITQTLLYFQTDINHMPPSFLSVSTPVEVEQS